MDTFTGTEKGDVFNAVQAGTAFVLGALDTIDGGAGVDTLNVQDTATAAASSFSFGAATIKNVENINVTTNGDFTGLDTTAITGLTSFTGKAAGVGATTLTVADTTDVTLTLGTTNNSTVTGGKAVSVTKGATAAGNLGITGKALTDVTVKGGNGVLTIDNTGGAAGTTTAIGTTLKTVTLDGVTGVSTAIKGAAIDTLVLKNQIAVQTTTITNDTSTSLTIKADGVGYTAAGVAAINTVNAGSKAATLNVEATGAKSALTLTGTAAKTVNITGTAALDLAQITTATKIDGSAATGNLTLNTLAAITVDVKTGAGNDKFTANTTNKLAIDSGAGNDIVTLTGGALVVGSTVNLGAGNDKLIGTVAVAKAGTGVTDSVIDAGEGMDTVSAALINAGNASLFKNFEGLSLNSTTGLDTALLSGSAISTIAIDSASTTALYQNLAVATVLDVSYVGDNSAVTNILSFKDVTGTNDTFAIKFSADNSANTTAATAANVKAGTILAAGVENFTIDSSGSNAWNSITLDDGAANVANTVKVTGASNLDLTFAAGFGSTTAPATGVSLIDGSAATGKLSINVAGITPAAVGITVKGGTAVDTITTSTFSTTLYGGTGADNFIVAGTTAGNVASVIGQNVTTIADIGTGDVITFTIGGANVFTTAKVDVSTATGLSGASINAYDLAVSAAGNTNNQITWFQYNGDTYIVNHVGASNDLDTGDTIVKLVGIHDLSTAAFVEGGAGASTLTIA